MSKELIRLRDLCMAFDDEPVLDHINLYINDKEVLTLLGPSVLSEVSRCLHRETSCSMV